MTEQNEYLCASCAVGLFDECSNPRSTDQEGYFLPCGLDMIAQAAQEQLEKGQRGGQLKGLDELTDDVSAGRKRAAQLAPIMSGMRCEWAGLKFAGGGPIPILGCLETTIADVKQVDKARELGADDVGHRHHGPDKAVMNNAVGMNLHRICSTCITGEMRLLMADLTWKRADEIQAGDKVFGFDEDLSSMRIKTAEVTSVRKVVEPSYRLHMRNGDVLTSSHAHQWVAARPSDAHVKWYETEKFLNTYETKRQGRFSLRKFLDPWETETRYEAGWLAGFLDGEGHLGQTHLSGSQTIEGDNIHPAETMLSMFEEHSPGRVNYAWRSDREGHKDALVVRITNLSDIISLLGRVRPSRLLAKAERFITGKRPIRRGNKEPIESVEFIGDTEVYSIETTSQTYIVEGYLSHNCHNRWHTLNDAHYGARPHVSKPFLPNVPYYGHDGFTSFTGDEYKIAEAWWAKPVDERGPYPFTPEARKLAPLSTPEFTAVDPFTGSDPFGE